MQNSDSEDGSDFFESAEESLDEEEDEKNDKQKLKKTLCESEVKECSSFKNTEGAGDGNNGSGGSMTYRQRPERVKRLNSRPSPVKADPISKKSVTKEPVFKAEKIVPDVFIQDITTSLSKNINKSLSTIQQTSSNVKDLIFRTLPVSSAKDNEVFSYDDVTDVVTPVECDSTQVEDVLKCEEVRKTDSEEFLNQVSCKSTEVADTDDKADLVCTESSSLVSSKNVNEYKQPESSKAEGESEVPNEDNVKADILDDNKKEEEVCGNENENEKNLTVSDIPSAKTELEKTVTEVHKLDEDSSISLDNVDDNLKKSDSDLLKDISNISQKSTSCDSKSLLLSEKLFSSQLGNSISDVGSLLSTEEIKDPVTDGVEELKSALKKMVLDEKSNDGWGESQLPEVNSSQEEMIKKEEVDESLKDGWDDFDFSDNEENCKNSQDKEKSDEIKSEKLGGVDINDGKTQQEKDSITKSLETDKSIPKKSSKRGADVSNNLSLSDGSLSDQKIEKNEKINVTNAPEIKNVSNERKLEVESKQSNDGWDWDDWDENPEIGDEKSQKVENVTPQKESDDFFDEKRWSGWETFGQKQEEKEGNWNIGAWGVNMILNKATAVTQGISSVLEAGLGAPDPVTLARLEKEEKMKRMQDPETEKEPSPDISETESSLFPAFGITSLVAGVTSKIVEHSKIQEIGSKVITGGLDTLESFGKKTMEVLQEGDPGLKNKRALLLGSDKTVLSQVLKEAREKAEREMKQVEEKEMAKKCHFETLFDDFQGMVHLEALEMLSRQCELKLEQMRMSLGSEEKEDFLGVLEEVEQLCSLDDDDLAISQPFVVDFKISLQKAVEPLKEEISVQRIVQIHEEAEKWLRMSFESKPPSGLVHQKVVSTLAELTAATVHQFHKAGELLSVKECRKTVEEVDALSEMTGLICRNISRFSQRFITLYRETFSNEYNSGNEGVVVSNIEVMMRNAVSYVKQAFNLLVPVVQVGAAL